MQDILRKLLANGFLVYPGNSGKYLLKKTSVPGNTTVMCEQEFDSFDAALEAARELLSQRDGPVMFSFSAIVRYNRGLGIEYKNLPDFEAASIEDAKEIARKNAEELLTEPQVELREVRVRPKF